MYFARYGKPRTFRWQREPTIRRLGRGPYWARGRRRVTHPAPPQPSTTGFIDLPDKLTWDGAEDPIIAPSAFKHGVSEDDILHAYRNPIRIFDLDDGFTMIIGANATAIIFEVGVIEGHTANVIVHAMRAREKYLR